MQDVITLNTVGEAAVIKSLVANFGCITFSQAMAICNNDRDRTTRICKYLERNRLAKRDDQELLVRAFFAPSDMVDSSVTDCLWVAINKALYKGEEGRIHIDHDTMLGCNRLNRTVQVSFVYDGISCNVIYADEASLPSVKDFMIEAYGRKTPEKMGGIRFIIAVRDLSLVATLRESELPESLKVSAAFLEGEVYSVPKIKFLKING